MLLTNFIYNVVDDILGDEMLLKSLVSSGVFCKEVDFLYHVFSPHFCTNHAGTATVPPIRSTGLILIEAPSSAYRRGMLALGDNHWRKRRRPHAILHPTAPVLLWHRSPCPQHVRLHLNQQGDIVVHRNMQASPDALLKVIAPYREDIVVAVECLLTWYWIADLWAQEGISFVLGHALYMKAIHGGKAKTDTIDAHKIAVLLRGGMLPEAYVYPAEMRATRDLWRRRMSVMRQRAALLTHVQHTNRQDTLPEIGTKIADQANREGVAERFPDSAVQKSLEVDLAWLGSYDHLLTELELSIVHAAQAHHAQIFYRLRSIPEVGKILALVLLDAIHDIHRFPRVQEFVSYCRLVKCAKESAGKRYGSSGTKIGNAYLTWAFSDAAVLFLRANPAGQKYLARLEKQHGKGKALTVLAHQLARAVYDMGKRDTVFDLDKFFHQ
jgi:transposase